MLEMAKEPRASLEDLLESEKKERKTLQKIMQHRKLTLCTLNNGHPEHLGQLLEDVQSGNERFKIYLHQGEVFDELLKIAIAMEREFPSLKWCCKIARTDLLLCSVMHRVIDTWEAQNKLSVLWTSSSML
jgi:hypothetical protein